jgi:hypothetical protein
MAGSYGTVESGGSAYEYDAAALGLDKGDSKHFSKVKHRLHSPVFPANAAKLLTLGATLLGLLTALWLKTRGHRPLYLSGIVLRRY